MYLDYKKFEEYGGKLTDTEFDRFLFRAEKEIDNVTLNRCQTLEEIPEEVQRCAFELVVHLSNTAKNGTTTAISGFGNDGCSVSYAEQRTPSQQIYDIIYTYLASTGLMYCGVD